MSSKLWQTDQTKASLIRKGTRENMNRISYITVALLISIAGCSDNFKLGDLSNFTLQSSIENMLNSDTMSHDEKIVAIFNEKNPDKRRKGIAELSRHPFAMRDKYLKAYSFRATPQTESDPIVRAVAIRTLGRANDSKYDTLVLGALSDPSEIVRWDACYIFAKIPNPKAITKLKELATSDTNLDVRQTAAAALRHYPLERVFDTLIKCLEDNRFEVRSAANKTLAFQMKGDWGYEPQDWIDAREKIKKGLKPKPKVIYTKRPFWDWLKVTKPSKVVNK